MGIIKSAFQRITGRFDALVDPDTERGGADDKTTRLRGNLSINTNLYNLGLYYKNGFLQNIIDQPAEDCTREWIKLRTTIDDEETETDEEKEISEMVEERLKEIGLQQKITELVRYSRMFAKGSFLYYGIIGENVQNKAILNQPLPEVVQSIDFINVIDDPDRVQLQIDNKTDPTIKNYNEVRFFMNGFEIHPSRLSWLVNSFLPMQESGISVVQTVEDAIKAQDSALWSVSSMLADMALKIFKSDDIAGLSITEKAKLLSKIKHLTNTQSVMALMKDEDFQKLIWNATGLKDVFEFVFDNLGGLAKIPRRILLGQSHGIVTGGEFDTLNYYANIAKTQENKLKPIIQKVIDMVKIEQRGQIYQKLGERVSEVNIDFTFNNLWILDPKTEADTNHINAQRDQIDQMIGKTNAAELRTLDERYKGLGEFVMDRTNLDPANLELPEEYKKAQEEKKKVKKPEEKEVKADKQDEKRDNQVQIFPIQIDIDNTKPEVKEKVKFKKVIKIQTDSENKITGAEVEEIDSITK